MDTNLQRLLMGASSVQEWAGLEQGNLIDGGGADTGGPNALPHGKHVWNPGNGANPGNLLFTPIKRKPGQPYDNLYCYNPITTQKLNASLFSWSLNFILTPADMKGNAREFEAELCEGGYTYNMAWQYKWSNVDGAPAWRYFDQIAQKWVAASQIPFVAPKANSPISITGFFVVDRIIGQTWHDSVIVNGQLYTINVAHPKKKKWDDGVNYLHNAAQIDSLGDGVACGIQLKNWVVRAI